jgi:hypothetical protein
MARVCDLRRNEVRIFEDRADQTGDFNVRSDGDFNARSLDEFNFFVK